MGLFFEVNFWLSFDFGWDRDVEWAIDLFVLDEFKLFFLLREELLLLICCLFIINLPLGFELDLL